MSQELVDVPKAAARLGVTPGTIYELIKRGSLRHVKVGRLIRISSDEVDSFIRRGGGPALVSSASKSSRR